MAIYTNNKDVSRADSLDITDSISAGTLGCAKSQNDFFWGWPLFTEPTVQQHKRWFSLESDCWTWINDLKFPMFQGYGALRGSRWLHPYFLLLEPPSWNKNVVVKLGPVPNSPSKPSFWCSVLVLRFLKEQEIQEIDRYRFRGSAPILPAVEARRLRAGQCSQQ